MSYDTEWREQQAADAMWARVQELGVLVRDAALDLAEAYPVVRNGSSGFPESVQEFVTTFADEVRAEARAVACKRQDGSSASGVVSEPVARQLP